METSNLKPSSATKTFLHPWCQQTATDLATSGLDTAEATVSRVGSVANPLLVLLGEDDRTASLVAVAQQTGAAIVCVAELSRAWGDLATAICPREELLTTIMETSKRTECPSLGSEIVQRIPELCDIVKKKTGTDLGHYRRGLLARRVEKRLGTVRLGTIDDYLEVLRDSRDEADILTQDILVNVTSFFRDEGVFEFLEQEIRSILRERGEIKLWSAGCASGQEAYSLAMLSREAQLELGLDDSCVKILATDVDEQSVRTARAGQYRASELVELSEDRLQRFFVPSSDGYAVSKELRGLCQFSMHSLISDPPFTDIDILLCRNVLIYLSTPIQEKLIPMFHFSLRSGGLLVLGSAETVGDSDVLFNTVKDRERIFRRTPGEPSRGWLPTSITPSNTSQDVGAVSFEAVVAKILEEEFTPRSCVVNEEGRILWSSGELDAFLGISKGDFRNNLIRLARKGIKSPLRSALLESNQSRRIATRRGLRVKKPKEAVSRLVDLTVQPMPEMGHGRGLFLVVFQDHPDRSRLDMVETVSTSAEEHLARELARVRDELERTVQELESSNEELKSSNEELKAMNEELRATNEELESARNRAQSKKKQLARANNDLEHLLASTNIPTIFLDLEQRILRFTPSASKIYCLQNRDLGRPLFELVHHAEEMPPLSEQSEGETRPIRLKDGKHYVRSVFPYRNPDGKVAGSVLVFSDVTEQHQYRERLSTLAAIVESSSDFIGVSDLEQEVKYLNQAALSLTNGREGDSIAAFHPRWATDLLESKVKDLSADTSWQGESALLGVDGEEIPVSQSVFPLLDDDGTITGYATIARDSRQVKERERQLRVRGRQFRDVLVKAPIPTILVSDERKILTLSEALVHITGLTPDTIGNFESWLLIAHREDADRVRDQLQPLFDKSASSVTFEAPVYTRAGDRRYWDFVCSRGPALDEAESNYIFMATDITEKRNQEKLLKEAADFLHRVLDSLAMFVGVLSPDGCLLQANRASLVDANLSADDVVGKPFWETYWWAHDEKVQQRLKDSLKKASFGEMVRYDEKVRLSEGTLVTMDFQLVPMKNEKDQVTHFIASGLDVTARRQAEEQLKESSERFLSLLDSVGESIYGIDLEGRCTFANRACVNELGFESEDDLLGESAHTLFHHTRADGTAYPVEECPIYQAFRENRPVYLERDYFYRQDGTRFPVECRSHPITLSNRLVGCVVSFTDITQKEKSQVQLDQALKSARSASVAKSEFLANMSHEIRTPMAAILGYVDVLLRHVSDPDDIECLKIIETNGQHLVRLINDILDLTKIEAGRLELEKKPVQIHHIVSELFSLMTVRAREKKLKLTSAFETEVPELILSDETRILQILVNLVGNAIKFTEEGSIHLAVALLPEDFLRFSVTDTGLGIPHDKLQLILEPFEQADTSVTRQYGGTGLGLSICKRLVSMLGGDLHVDSTVGEGSTFSFTIRIEAIDGVKLIQPESLLTLKHAPAATEAPDLSGTTVLVVDDRRDIATLAVQYLEDAGAKADLAFNGMEALERLREGSFDVLVMDMQMPILDGYETAREIRESGSDLPILALTASAMKGDREKCIEAGCTAYLSKPVDRMGLLNQVARLKSGRESVRVLVVEDSKMAAMAVSTMLRATGCIVEHAASGNDAVRLFERLQPDLVLLDLGLPDMPPDELLGRLRKLVKVPNCKFVAHTGRAKDEEILGYDGYIQKPASRALLESLVFGLDPLS
jgi:two-component system, chemotaxis family, CheB/CheR fusion protein